MPNPEDARGYTVADTPEVVAKIESDLGTIRDAVRAADPSLRSLVLTGAFARGEGAFADGKPWNDYDLVAIRGLAPPRVPYEHVRAKLEDRLGIHIDLQPVWSSRLPWASRSIFWYETALRGRVVWGANHLPDIRTRSPSQLHPTEAMRLLVNRAAGLLLARPIPDAKLHRIQAAKGLLAALDAQLLAGGEFAPSQTERWRMYVSRRDAGCDVGTILGERSWYDWAFRFKVDPANAPARDPQAAWDAAARAILSAVPSALALAKLPSVEAYGRADGLLDLVYYYRNSSNVPGAHRRLFLHPTGRVRLATLVMLRDVVEGRSERDAAQKWLSPLARVPEGDPIPLLDALRKATLQ